MWHQDHMMEWGNMAGMGIIGILIPLMLLALTVLAIIAIVKMLKDNKHTPSAPDNQKPSDNAIAILNKRFAQGEITLIPAASAA